jgi:hypothetical protein
MRQCWMYKKLESKMRNGPRDAGYGDFSEKDISIVDLLVRDRLNPSAAFKHTDGPDILKRSSDPID